MDLSRIRKKIEEILVDSLGGQLGLSMGSAGFGPGELKGEGRTMGQVLKQAGLNCGMEKRRRFHTLAQTAYDKVFGACSTPGECSVCHCALDFPAEDDALCETCHFFIELGSKLRTAKFLVETTPHPTHALRRFGKIPKPIKNIKNIDFPLQDKDRIFQLNGFDDRLLSNARKHAPNGARLSLGAYLMGVRTPKAPDSETVTTFEDLAKQSSGDTNHISILRADVDNLGRIFQEVITLSDLATLSRAVSEFFDGRVTAILEEKKYKDKTYLVYAGGDDLMVVGAWDAVISAARDIRDEFFQYTGNKHTLSAGIAVVHPKFPLKRSAQEAGDGEKSAKSLPEKDAVCVMGQPLGWGEFSRVQRIASLVAEAVTKGGHRQLITRLRLIWWVYEKARKNLKTEGKSGADLEEAARWNRWRWLLVYGLRNDAGKYGERIQKELLDGKMQACLGLVSRLAELMTRR